MDAAIRASLNAALKALRAGSPSDAVAALEPALSRAVDRELEEAEMLVRGLLAPALGQLGDLEPAEEHARRAHAIAVHRDDERSAQEYGGLADQLQRSRQADEPPPPLSEAEMSAALDAAGEALTAARPEDAETLLDALVESTEQSGHAAVEASARGMLAQALVMQDRMDEAGGHLERALAIAERMNEPEAAEHFRDLLGGLDGGAGEKVERSRIHELCDRARDEAGEAMEADRFEEAVAALEPALRAAEEEGAPAAEASVRGMLAQALLLLERREDAASHAARALELAEAGGDEEAIEGFRQLLALTTGWKPEVGEA